MSKKVYLAGPITGLKDKDFSTWREYSLKYLEENGIQALCPLRNKERMVSLAGEEIKPIGESLFDVAFKISKWDVERCDVVLVNFLNTTKVSIGTSMEIAWAYQLNKIIVVVIEEQGNPHDYFFLNKCATIRIPTLDLALKYITKIVQI